MRRIPTRGNQHGHRISYKKKRGMVLQKEYIEREKGENPIIVMWSFCVTSLTENLPPMKRLHKRKNRRL